MKQSPDLSRVQERMQPGELTLHGFLGTDTRNLADILAQDGEAVRACGTTHEKIADRLAEIAEQGRDIMEEEKTVAGRFRVRVRDDRGLIPSPWGDGLFEKGDVSMIDDATGRAFRWNPLTLHLIRTHGFYGGKGSAYRIDPREITDTLGSVPDGQ